MHNLSDAWSTYLPSGKKEAFVELAPYKNWDNPPLRMYMYHGVDLGFLAYPLPIHTQSDSDTSDILTCKSRILCSVFLSRITDHNEVCLIAQWTRFLIIDYPLYSYRSVVHNICSNVVLLK